MGTIAELRNKIDEGISIGLEKFTTKFEREMNEKATKAEEHYYADYSSWYDPYRRFDIMNMHNTESVSDNRIAIINIEFSPSFMKGGHGFAPLHNDPGQVFEWGFETGNHGWYVPGTPVRIYWQQYFKILDKRAKHWAIRYVTQGLKSVGL